MESNLFQKKSSSELKKTKKTIKEEDDERIDEFYNLLTPERIKLLNLIFKEKHVDIRNTKENRIKDKTRENENKIGKSIFIKEINNVFKSSKSEIDLKPLFEIFFNRFKILTDSTGGAEEKGVKGAQKASQIENKVTQKGSKDINKNLLSNSKSKNDNKSQRMNNKIMKNKEIKSELKDNFPKDSNGKSSVISNQASEEEEKIDAYEVIIALCIFSRLVFDEKIKLLFEITDVDDDGYINQIEIKKLIYTIHLNFSEETTPIDCNSYLLNQSLACIKAQQIIDMIINYPGKLSEIIEKEKYVQYENFIDAIKKIPNHNYKIIPMFISLKASLDIVRKELELPDDKHHLWNVISLSKDVCSIIKNSVNYISSSGSSIGKLKNDVQFNKISEYEQKLSKILLEKTISLNPEKKKNHIPLEEVFSKVRNDSNNKNDDLQDGESYIKSKIEVVNKTHETHLELMTRSMNIKSLY